MLDKKEINPRRPIPHGKYTRLRENLKANFKPGFPSIEGDFPGPDTRPSPLRGEQISRKNDKLNLFEIG